MPQEHTELSRRNLLKLTGSSTALLLAGAASAATARHPTKGSTMQLTQDWDKVFPKSDKVDHQKVTFKNRYGITLVGRSLSAEGPRATGACRRLPSAARSAR